MVEGLPPVKIQFVAGGVAEVKSAMKNLEQAIIQHDKTITASQKSSARDRVISEKQAIADAVRLEKEGQKEKLTLLKESLKQMTEEQRKKYKEDINLEKQAQREALRVVKERVSEERRILREAERENRHIRRDDRWQFLKSSLTSLGVPGVSTGTRVAAQFMGESVLRAAGGGGGAAAAAGGVSLAGGIAIGAGVAAAVGALYLLKKGVDLVVDGLTSAAHEMVGAVITIGGGFSIGESLVKAARAEREAAKFSIASGSPGNEQYISTSDVLRTARAMSHGTEFETGDILASARAYQKITGRGKSFFDMSKDLTQIASVTGASMQQVGQTAGQFKIQFPNLSNNEMVQLLKNTVAQGMKGAIEFEDMAKAAEISSKAEFFGGGNKVANVTKALGFAQLTMAAAGSSDEAITGGKRFLEELVSKSTQISAAIKTNVLEKGKITDPERIAAKIAAYVEGSSPHLMQAQKWFGERGIKTVEGIMQQTEIKPGMSQKQKEDAYYEAIVKFTRANQDGAEFQEMFNKSTKTSEYQLKEIFNELKSAVGEDLAKALKESMPGIKDFVKTLAGTSPVLGALFHSLANILPTVISAFENLIPILFGAMRTFLRALMTAGTITPQEYLNYRNNINESEGVFNYNMQESKRAKKDKFFGEAVEGINNEGLTLDQVRERLKGAMPSVTGVGNFVEENPPNTMTYEQYSKLLTQQKILENREESVKSLIENTLATKDQTETIKNLTKIMENSYGGTHGSNYPSRNGRPIMVDET